MYEEIEKLIEVVGTPVFIRGESDGKTEKITVYFKDGDKYEFEGEINA